MSTNKLTFGGSLIGIGLGIGWLAGLSASPVVSTIITGLIGLAASIISILSGVKVKEGSLFFSQEVNPLPIFCIVIGIVLGSVVGIWFRTNNFLGKDIEDEVEQWTRLNIERKTVIRNLFKLHFSPDGREVKPSQSEMTLLFSEKFDACSDLLQTKNNSKFLQKLNFSSIQGFQKLPTIITDIEKLREVVNISCQILSEE